MLLIKEVIIPLIEGGHTKYRVAKELGVQPIMIDHYLKGNVRTPSFRVCKTIYDKYGIVTFPYCEEELDQEGEQTLINFD